MLSFHGDIFLFIYLFCCFFFPVGPQMSVQLEASPDFTAVPVGDDQDSYCLSANGRHTSSWLVTPKSLGEWKFCEGDLPRKGKYFISYFLLIGSQRGSAQSLLTLVYAYYTFNTRQALGPLLETRMTYRSRGFGRSQVPGRSELSSLDCLFQGMWISLCLRKHNSPQSPVVLRWPQFLKLGERTQ